MCTTKTPVKTPDDLLQPGQASVCVLAAEGPVAEMTSLRVVDKPVDIAALDAVGVASALTDLLRNVSRGVKPLIAVISRKSHGGKDSSEAGNSVSSESRQRVWRAACALCARLSVNTTDAICRDDCWSWFGCKMFA